MQVFEDSLVSQEHPGTTVSPPAIATCPLVQVSEDSPVSQEHPKTTVTILPPAVAICSLVQASIRGFPCVPRTSWDYCITICSNMPPPGPSIQGFPCVPGTSWDYCITTYSNMPPLSKYPRIPLYPRNILGLLYHHL